MLFILSLIIAITFAMTGKSTIKRHPYPWYIGALCISVFVSRCSFSPELPEFFVVILDLFRRGALACALWCVVMWTGALSNGSFLIKRLMPIRGELSIFAAALTLGHNIGYGRTYFARFFTNASALSANQFAACIVTIILLIIMIPLTILSFPKIRKRMKAKQWKKIQRFAYLFYALLYVHIMLLFIPFAHAGRDGYYFSVIVYSAVFIAYALCRIRKWIFLKKKPARKHEISSIFFGIFLALMLLVCAFAHPKNITDNDSMQNSSSEASSEVYSETDLSAADTNAFTENTVSSSKFTDGTYQGKAYGYDGTIKASVTIKDGKIADISCSSEESDLWYFEKCEAAVVADILASQDTEVDSVSGATYSSNGIKKAVLNALEQALTN